MIKILPREENNKKNRPFFRLVVTLGYGEHCTDTYTESCVEIDDKKAIKYESLSDKEAEKMDWEELNSISNCITQEEAEKIVKFFNSLWNRKDKEGFEASHVVLNDGPDSFWWKEQSAMTDEEFDWFSQVYEKYQNSLFNPQIEHNWYGVVSAKVEYVSGRGLVHRCEVI